MSSFDLLVDPDTVQEQRSFTVKQPTAKILTAFFREFAPAAFDLKWCGKTTTFCSSEDMTLISALVDSSLVSYEDTSTGEGGLGVHSLFELTEDFGVLATKRPGVDGCCKNLKTKILITDFSDYNSGVLHQPGEVRHISWQ